tara:strand:- start:8679 stop:8921 length:243 start_codon:yes stop_codon:yes gene_type:complete
MALPFGDGEIPERAPRANELARTEGPPNVIVILADDIGVEPLALFGGSIETPNLAVWRRRGYFLNARSPLRCARPAVHGS